MPCELCAPFGGKWRPAPAGGMTRCTCATGQQLAAVDEARKTNRAEPPRLNHDDTIVILEMLAGLDFFPPEGGARLLITEELRRMVASPEQGAWLALRMSRLYTKWPGIRDLRMVYCQRYRPLDGIELSGSTEAYPDGIPSELPAPQDQKYFGPGPGEPASAAESVSLTVEALVKSKSLQNAGKRVTVPTIPLLPKANRITPVDIAQAIEVNRNRVAQQELGDE